MKPPSRTTRPFSFGPLYDFLFAMFPEHRSSQGVFDVERFSKDMGVSKEAVYRFLRKNTLNPEQTDKIVALLVAGRHVLTLDDYAPLLHFVFKGLPIPQPETTEAA